MLRSLFAPNYSRRHAASPASQTHALAPAGSATPRNFPERPLQKVQRTELDDTVLLRTVRDMDSLIDRETVDLPVLVVNVGTERRDSVRTEYLTVR